MIFRSEPKLPKASELQVPAPIQAPPRERVLSEHAASVAQRVLDLEDALEHCRHTSQQQAAEITRLQEENHFLQADLDRIREEIYVQIKQATEVKSKLTIVGSIILDVLNQTKTVEQTESQYAPKKASKAEQAAKDAITEALNASPAAAALEAAAELPNIKEARAAPKPELREPRRTVPRQTEETE